MPSPTAARVTGHRTRAARPGATTISRRGPTRRRVPATRAGTRRRGITRSPGCTATCAATRARARARARVRAARAALTLALALALALVAAHVAVQPGDLVIPRLLVPARVAGTRRRVGPRLLIVVAPGLAALVRCPVTLAAVGLGIVALRAISLLAVTVVVLAAVGLGALGPAAVGLAAVGLAAVRRRLAVSLRRAVPLSALGARGSLGSLGPPGSLGSAVRGPVVLAVLAVFGSVPVS